LKSNGQKRQVLSRKFSCTRGEVDYRPVITSGVVLRDQTLFRTEEEVRDTPTGQLVTQGFN